MNHLQLPNAQFLKTHFAIAEILHASGMAQEIEEVLRDTEEIDNLEPNGGTDVGRLLSTAAWTKLMHDQLRVERDEAIFWVHC